MSANNSPSLILHISHPELRSIIAEEIARALSAGTIKQKDDTMLSPAQAGKLLGISAKQVIRIIQQDQIKAYRVGKLFRISRHAITAYLKACDLSQFN